MKRQTVQRKAILVSFSKAKGPLTPQEVLEHTQKIQPNLSLATVYRTLKLLEHENHIVAVHIPSESPRYELKRSEHHHHFYCQVCEIVYDLEVACPIASLTNTSLPGGFAVTNHDLTFYGLCPTCQT